jgi:hypothetical protein
MIPNGAYGNPHSGRNHLQILDGNYSACYQHSPIDNQQRYFDSHCCHDWRWSEMKIQEGHKDGDKDGCDQSAGLVRDRGNALCNKI